jgi:hypothetical protein
LTGDNAFHIRRLVAETFAEQAPHDEDWPLLRDQRDRHRDVFQVIYLQATRVEWHRFWMTHLVPFLKDLGDVGGLTIHVHRTSQWTSDDAAGVLTFWAEVLTVEGVDKAQLGHSIAHAIAKLQTGACDLAAPVLAELLKLPHQQHSFLGHALARCIEHGGLDDATLWRYIAGEIEDNDVLAYRFDKKLRCHPNEFGNSNNTFLTDRMCNSTSLLDFAVASVEQWSRIKTFRFDEVSTAVNRGFLNDTSYEDSHTQNDHRHLDNERILMDAIEAAIVNHASTQSDWWLENRERLCVNQEGALRYFAILACTAAPIANVDVIGRMLCDKALLESPLCYELGTLMQTALVHLDADTQDTVQATVLSLHEESESEVGYREWLLKHSSVPTFFRGERAAEARNRDLKDARAA